VAKSFSIDGFLEAVENRPDMPSKDGASQNEPMINEVKLKNLQNDLGIAMTSTFHRIGRERQPKHRAISGKGRRRRLGSILCPL
jgi:hypothetical protein